MGMLSRVRSAAVVTAIVGVLMMSPSTDARRPVGEKPNIVYLMLDEWGYFEWSGMGHPILETPNIDKFASEGMRFTQFLAGGNVCAPTRSLGQRPRSRMPQQFRSLKGCLTGDAAVASGCLRFAPAQAANPRTTIIMGRCPMLR